MRPITVSQTGVGPSVPIVLDYLVAPFQVSIGCKVTGTATFTVEHTYDDPFASGFSPLSATWFPNATLTAKTANAEGSYTLPVRAIRLSITSGTGTVAATIVQAGWNG